MFCVCLAQKVLSKKTIVVINLREKVGNILVCYCHMTRCRHCLYECKTRYVAPINKSKICGKIVCMYIELPLDNLPVYLLS